MILHLFRFASTDIATIGRLSDEKTTYGETLERPWLDNRPRVSCIPPGRYLLAWEPSPRLKRNTLRLVDVPGRSGILIHPANKVTELAGCIAIGTRPPTAPDTLTRSRQAVQALETEVKIAMFDGFSVYLEIHNP